MKSGIIASPGVCFGKVFLLEDAQYELNKSSISDKDIVHEKQKFLSAKKTTLEQLEKIKYKALQTFGEEKEAIFEGHILLVDDEELENEIIELISNKKLSADFATYSIMEEQASSLEQLDDEYLKERATDLRDISDRLIRNIFVEYFSPVAWLGCCYQLTVVEERLGKLRQWRPESSLPSQHCVTLALIYLVLPPLMITIMIITNFNKTFPRYRIVFHRSCFVQTKLGVYCTLDNNTELFLLMRNLLLTVLSSW